MFFFARKSLQQRGQGGKYLGKGHATKSDEFSEKFQTAFDPTLIYENYIAKLYPRVQGPGSMRSMDLIPEMCVLFDCQCHRPEFPCVGSPWIEGVWQPQGPWQQLPAQEI